MFCVRQSGAQLLCCCAQGEAAACSQAAAAAAAAEGAAAADLAGLARLAAARTLLVAGRDADAAAAVATNGSKVRALPLRPLAWCIPQTA